MVATRKKRDKRRERLSGRKRAETHKGGFEGSSVQLPDGVDFFAVKKAGVYRLEIIPYIVPEGANNPNAEPGDLYFERTFWIHRGVGADNGVRVCPRKTANQPCAICDHRAKLAKDPDADENLIKDLSPKERQLWNVFDHADPEKKDQVWDVSYHLFGKQLDARIKNADEDDEYEFFADPEEGLTLKVGFAERSFSGNTFYEAETIDFKTRRTALDPELFESANLLDSLLIIEPYDKLKAEFLQTGGDDTDDDTDDDPPPKKKTRKRTTKKKPTESEETAEKYGISKGDEVDTHTGGICTVLKISSDGTSLTLKDDDGEIHRAVSPADVKLIPEEEEEVEEEKPKKAAKKTTKTTKKTKASPPPDDDDDDGDDDDDDDDDDDEPWDDDDDDFDDDDD